MSRLPEPDQPDDGGHPNEKSENSVRVKITSPFEVADGGREDYAEPESDPEEVITGKIQKYASSQRKRDEKNPVASANSPRFIATSFA